MCFSLKNDNLGSKMKVLKFLGIHPTHNRFEHDVIVKFERFLWFYILLIYIFIIIQYIYFYIKAVFHFSELDCVGFLAPVRIGNRSVGSGKSLRLWISFWMGNQPGFLTFPSCVLLSFDFGYTIWRCKWYWELNGGQWNPTRISFSSISSDILVFRKLRPAVSSSSTIGMSFCDSFMGFWHQSFTKT